MEALIRSLQQASGDAVVVATNPHHHPTRTSASAVKMFGIADAGSGSPVRTTALVILASTIGRCGSVADLQQFITAVLPVKSAVGMAPEFRRGAYGPGFCRPLRVVARIARGRNVTLRGVRPRRRPARTSAPVETSSGALHCLHPSQRDWPDATAPVWPRLGRRRVERMEQWRRPIRH